MANDWLYTGRQFDPENGLYFYRSRYYDARVGRFTTRDPIGYGGGINLYVYVKNNSINKLDPFGLFWEKVFSDTGRRAAHMDRAISYQEFIDYAAGKSSSELQKEQRGSGTQSGLGGPREEYRYVRDSANH